jgi:hypothetical protein
MLAFRTIATTAAVFLAATPVLVRAAQACHCDDHMQHVAPKTKPEKSCCHRSSKSAADEEKEACKRLDSHRCCSKHLIQLERAPATNDKRPVVDSMLVAPDPRVLVLLAPPGRADLDRGTHTSRAPPGLTLPQLCVLLI